jgi:hypothetical protein
MKLEEINIISIGDVNNSELKRKVISEHLGEQVILYDRHERWVHALILDENYTANYSVKIGDDSGKKTLLYQNLQKLIILKPTERNYLPEIN